MTDSSELVAVELTDDERDFIQQTLEQWALSAASKPFPFQVLGLSTWEEFGNLTGRLEHAVTDGEPMTDLDWARVLFLTEITWASMLIGSGLDFAIVTRFSDSEAVSLLRGLQRKQPMRIKVGDPVANRFHHRNKKQEQNLAVDARLAQAAPHPAPQAQVDKRRKRPDLFRLDEAPQNACSQAQSHVERQGQVFVVKDRGR